MIELDLNDDKSELTKVVVKVFAHISRVMLYESLLIFDRRLNSIKYIYILQTYSPRAFAKYPPAQWPKIFSQDTNVRPHVLTTTKTYFKRKRIKQIIWSGNSPHVNIIENIWSIIDN